MRQPTPPPLAPPPPAWVVESPACLWAWDHDPAWRADAATATSPGYQHALEATAGTRYAATMRRGRGRPPTPPAARRRLAATYLTDAERAAIAAVLRPDEDFSGFMREAARLLIAARRGG